MQAGQRHKGLDLLPKMGGGEKNLGLIAGELVVGQGARVTGW